MMDFFRWIENTGFSTWVRESPSVWAFPTVLLIHTIGMGLVVGVNAGIDLRILGLAPKLPLSPMEKYFPILWTGFWMNAVTGVVLLAQDASTKMINPDFYLKMVFIALAVVNVQMLRKRVFRDPLVDKRPPSTNVKILAVTSLIFWLGAITTGRLLAYVGAVSGLSK
jgi:hypothetical protein